MQVQEHTALAPYTTFKIGGPARYFVAVKNEQELHEALAFAKEKQIPVFILGGGSNVLISDAGFAGLVIKIGLRGIERDTQVSQYRLMVGAGEAWDGLVQRAVDDGAWGIENLSGIPGTVGGAVVQNIGAYGAAFSEVIHSVHVFDTEEMLVKELSAHECEFGYRSSRFKTEEGKYVVLFATLLLSRTPKPNLSYKDLAHRFENKNPTIQEIRTAVLEIRKEKFPDLSVEGTAGSFFKNPIMSKDEAELLTQRYPEMPLFDMPETEGVKVPLAWLLDKALQLKGYALHGVRLYEKQPLVVVASRTSSARDVQQLTSSIQKKVFDELKIKIEPEVKII